MRFARRLIGVAMVVALFGASAAADTAAVRKDLEKKYATIDRAATERNLKGIFANTTADFTMTDHSGKRLTRAQAEQLLSKQMRQLPSDTKIKSAIIKLTVAGKRASADVRGEMSATLTGQDRKPHSMVASSVTRDTWVATKAGWKLKASVEVSTGMSMDGKPFNPMGAGAARPRKR
jgi:hypothetical protein